MFNSAIAFLAYTLMGLVALLYLGLTVRSMWLVVYPRIDDDFRGENVE